MQKYFDEALTRIDKRAAYFRPDLVGRRLLVASVDPYFVILQAGCSNSPKRLFLPQEICLRVIVHQTHNHP